MMLIGLSSYAQILVSESFEGTVLPSGFTSVTDTNGVTTPSFGTSAGIPCAGSKAVYRNMWSSASNWNLIYSSTASNGAALQYSFQYQAKAYGGTSVVSGDIQVQYSVDGGATYTTLLAPVNLSTTSGGIIACTTVSGTIAAGMIPSGANFKLKIRSSYKSPGDYFMGIDNFSLAQVLTSAPLCSSPILPANNSTGMSLTPNLTWGVAAGTTNYLLNLGTTSGGTDVLNAYDAGTSLNYSLPSTSALLYSTTYYFSVAPSNIIGTATGCSENSFTTLNIPCPVVSAPASNVIGQPLKPSIIWSSVSGVTGYTLSVGTTAGGTDILNALNLGNVTTYTFPTNLNVSTKYFYTVKAYQGTNSSVSCVERNFTTGAFPPPINDDCSGAITLNVNPDLTCGSIGVGNTLGASQSMAAAPCLSYPDDDIWYKFVATNTSHDISITNIVSTGIISTTDMFFEVLGGSCGNLISALCSNDDTNTVTGLTVGNTYFVRVFTNQNGNYNAYFNICIATPPPSPVNDEWSGAVMLTVNPNYNCGIVTAATTKSATQSTETSPTCSPAGIDDDVWFKFIATDSVHRISIVNTGGLPNMVMSLYSGTSGSLVHLQCSDPEIMNVTGLTAGTEYTIRVWTLSSSNAAFSNFTICVGSPPPPPTNDDCTTAIPLTVNADFNCGVKTAGSTYLATASTDVLTPCTGDADDDVWYSFVATNISHVVSLTDVESDGTLFSTSLFLQILTGNCGSLNSLICDTTYTSPLVLTGLTVGTKYYARVYNSKTNSVSYANSFKICIGTRPPPPANDDCANAIVATPPTVGFPYINSQDATYATNNGGFVGSCSQGMNDGVWYSVVGNGTTYTVLLSNVVSWDAELAVYTGACGAFTCVASADIGVNGGNETVTFSTVPGETYYINIGHFSPTIDIAEGPFTISINTNGTLAIANIAKDDSSINIYPNPFSDIVNISDINDVISISIIDLSGRIVKTIKPARQLNLGDLKTGMYLINFKMKDGSVQTMKAIKK